MVTRRRTTSEPKQSRGKPATTPEGRENQLIALAVGMVEERIREGKASAQELVHYLKLGSTREKLEQERLAAENKLLLAKVESMASAKDQEAMYKAAIAAMRSYSGQEPYSDDREYDD